MVRSIIHSVKCNGEGIVLDIPRNSTNEDYTFILITEAENSDNNIVNKKPSY